MSNLSQIRGMLLEEAVLYLLQASGYIPVQRGSNDPESPLTGDLYRGGLKLAGRGSEHQIDAIADYSLTLPFSYPTRLLVEAKCYSDSRHIGVDKIRNAVGVLKDVEEYWVGRHGVPRKGRYHYQYSYFSTSPFTSVAQRYAFAHDIYLVPLARSQFAQTLIQSIRAVRNESLPSVSDLRITIRQALDSTNERAMRQMVENPDSRDQLQRFVRESRAIEQAFVAVIGNRFPIFLVPGPNVRAFDLSRNLTVRIFMDDQNHWYIRNQDGAHLFSFDLPMEFFELYKAWASLMPIDIYRIKAEFLSKIQIVATRGDEIRVITMWLDEDWFQAVGNRLGI